MTQSEEAFFKEKGFGLTLGFGKTPVLIVVDITYAFTDPGTFLGSNLDAQVDSINRLLDAAHASGVPVIFTTVWYEDDDLRDAGVWAKKQKGVQLLRAGTRMVELDARLHRGPKDALLVKKYASSFFGTDLVPRLLSHGADTLVITGCSTSGCVRATAVDACQWGFRPMVVREAVGDRSTAAHEQSLFDLHSRYADVVGIEQTLEYFKA
ncbi:MAG TPA: isochorismatase family protein [Burkholderiales bacterium]|nr:isochorismatase family protein [Burkholderiales bacterium]